MLDLVGLSTHWNMMHGTSTVKLSIRHYTACFIDLLLFTSWSSYTGTVFGLTTVCFWRSLNFQEKLFIIWTMIKLDLTPFCSEVQISDWICLLHIYFLTFTIFFFNISSFRILLSTSSYHRFHLTRGTLVFIPYCNIDGCSRTFPKLLLFCELQSSTIV